MANEAPAYLTAGIEVSAKYRGAFCEAKVKKVDKNVKIKVTLKDDGKAFVVQDDDIKGTLRVGATVEVKRPDTGQFVEATINRISDLSTYTVIFDDGDENSLRRTKLCLKGDRHFMKSETLDDLPLTHPEHFSTPVVKKAQRSKATSTATCSESESESESSDEDSETGKRTYSIHSQQNLVGRVLCVDFEERSRRSTIVPVLVVLPSADDVQLPRHHVLVKSFKDGKFFTATIADTKEFTPEIIAKNRDKALKIAFDKAQAFKERRELPQNWSRMDLLGYSSSESGESSDDEPDEKKDRFVAELYKFMDDRGTPINKAPNLGGYDLNLFKLFRIVQTFGGYNRVTNQMKWHVVHSKLNLPTTATVVSTNIKQAYKKYLHAFEDFDRKLGCTMVMSSHSRMSSRSLVSFRERDRDQTPKQNRNKRVGSIRDEEPEKAQGKGEQEIEKTDKLNTPLPPNKTGVGGGTGTTTTTFSVRTRTAKKSGAKKESSDSDSVASDIAAVPRAAVSLAANSSVTKAAETVKSVGVSLRVMKDSEKQTQSTSNKSVSQTVKEEPARVTRGDSLKIKEPSVKEERAEKSRVATKGDAKESNKSRTEAEKVCEKSDVDKEEKLKGSRRVLRRGTANIPSAEDEVEDEARSTNSEKASSDDPSENNDSTTNDEPEADEEMPKVITGRRHTSHEDLYPTGTRLQVRYGKGKGQKVYEAKVLDISVTSGIVKYFVHYNGWNSRYDEWIHKDVIVSVLEEPPLEMPKLRSNVTPSIKSQSSSVRKKVNVSSSSSLTSNKEEIRHVKSRATASTTEMPSLANRKTRSHSVDQVKSMPGRSRLTNIKAAETGSNSSSSSSSSSSLLSEVDEKDNTNEQGTTESKLEQNLDEELSNSYRSCSPVETPEMPDIYLSEEEDNGKDGMRKRADQDAPCTSEDASCELPVIELENVNVTQHSEEDCNAGNASERLLMPEVLLCEGLDTKAQETIANETKCRLKAESAKPVEEDSAVASSDNAVHELALVQKDKTKETADPVPLLDNVCEQTSDLNSARIPILPSADSSNDRGDEALREVNVPPTLVESCSAVAAKTRRKKKALEKETSSDEGAGDKKKMEVLRDVKSDKAVDASVSEISADGEKKVNSKRKLSCCVDLGDDQAMKVLSEAAAASEGGVEEEKDTSCATESAADSKLNCWKPLPRKSIHLLSKETSREKPSKRTKLIKTDVDGTESKVAEKSEPLAKTSEAENVWKFEVKPESTEVETEKQAGCPNLSTNLKTEIPNESESCKNDKSNEAPILKPAASLPQKESRVQDEEASLLSEFAVKCSKEMELKDVFNDSPPASAENSPSAQDDATSPSHEEHTSTKSEQEANMEVEAYMEGRLEICCDSQSGYEFSTTSSDSTTSSSSSIRGFDNDVPSLTMSRKKKFEEDSRLPQRKRRKDKHGEENLDRANDSDHDISMSKLNRSTSGSSPAKSSSHAPAESSHHHHHHHHHQHHQQQPLHPPSKYNFIDLEEGKYLEGEDRIIFLTNKIQDLRATYMELKAEVASIDRRRRRHRVKEKEMAQSGVGSSVSTLMST